MIIVRISGSLAEQLAQYTFGLSCAEVLHTDLKLDVLTQPSIVDSFGIFAELATVEEVELSRSANTLVEPTSTLYDDSIWGLLGEGAYLLGSWLDYRYSERILPTVSRELMSHAALRNGFSDIYESISLSVSVSIDLRTGQAVPPPIYFNDAIAEMQARVPDAQLFVLCEDKEFVLRQYQLGDNYTLLSSFSSQNEEVAIALMAKCHHHIVGNQGASFLAAWLSHRKDSIVIAPQKLFDAQDGVMQPIWPPQWTVFPTRLIKASVSPDTIINYDGGSSLRRRIRVGVANFYERYTTNGYLFKNPQVPNGHNSLQPWCDLHAYGQAHGIDFVTLDQVTNIATELDAVIFMERPKADNTLAEIAMSADIFKILVIYECPLIKPDNWDTEFHKQFELIFTWDDNLVDGRRYVKSNFVSALEFPYDLAVLKSAFLQRKPVTMINSSVVLDDAYASQFPTELYTHRIRSIRWFEANAAKDFDLYGLGWNVEKFPSYKGAVRDKLATLSHYRFAICYENAHSYPGYISEKIQDCLLSGVVPVYGGAPNVDAWIPSDCYIDIRQFQSYDALYAHLASMDAKTHGQYLDRIHNFLSTRKAYPFSTECFITTLTKFLVWGVQTKRCEIPEMATNGANANTHCLEQDLNTMEVNVVPKVLSVNTVVSVATVRAAMAELNRDDLIVCLGYGPELPVFLRARAIWQFYASHFPRIKIIFVRWNEQLPRGEIMTQGNDLVIGVGSEDISNYSMGEGYSASGVWSATENERTIFRQIALYDYLLRKYNHPFHLFQSTITSIVDFRGLISVLDVVPPRSCFAGMPGRLVHAPYEGVGIVHGANTLVSRDVMELMRSRYVPGHEYTKQPNDHWQGLVLSDVSRTALPLFSFNRPRSVGSDLEDIFTLTGKLLRDGHYHFRIKTTSAESGLGSREDIDPWIMLKIMEAIMHSLPSPVENKALQRRFALCCEPEPVQARNFPIDDSESGIFYPV